MKFSPTLRTTLVIAAAGIVIGSEVTFGILPLSKAIETKESNIRDARIEQAIAEKQREDLGAIQRQFTKIEKDVDQLSQAFITTPQALDFITALEAISERNGVLQDIRLDPARTLPTKDAGFVGQATKFELNVQGPFPNVLAYLHDFEAIRFITPIVTVSVRRPTASSSSGNAVVIHLAGSAEWSLP